MLNENSALARSPGRLIFGWPLARGWSCALLVVFGCTSESDRRPISGTVSVDGTLVARGSISFFPDRGHAGPAASTAISAGNYRFTTTNGPSAGPHRVVIGIETDVRGMMEAAPDLAASSATAKLGPGDNPNVKAGSKEPIRATPSRTQWNSTTQVPTANSPTANQSIDFVLQSDVDSGANAPKEPQ